jgi:hypothetical protein
MMIIFLLAPQRWLKKTRRMKRSARATVVEKASFKSGDRFLKIYQHLESVSTLVSPPLAVSWPILVMPANNKTPLHHL